MTKLKTRSVPRLAVLLVLLATVSALAGTLYYLQEVALPKRFSSVEPGILYRSSQPKTGQLDNVIEEYAIKTVVIAREGASRAVPDEEEFCRSQGLNVVHIPVESRKPVTDEQVKQFFEIVDNPVNQPVLVHCSAGRHRTGYLCAMYRIERMSWSVEDAVQEMLSFGFDTTDQSVVLDQLKAYQPGKWKRRVSKASPESRPSASNPS